MDEKATSTGINASIYHLVLQLRRVPFSLCMLAILLVVAWWTNSYFQELTHAWINRLGFAPRDLWFFRWWRLVLSAFVTSGGITFWLVLGMVAFTSGVAEWLSGSVRAALVFWGVHLVTLVSEALIFTLPLHQLGFSQPHAVYYLRDIGPSAGYMGSLGYIMIFLPKPWRWVAFGIILVYLVVFLLIPSGGATSRAIEFTDDLAHLIAFPLGWLTATLIGKRVPVKESSEYVR